MLVTRGYIDNSKNKIIRTKNREKQKIVPYNCKRRVIRDIINSVCMSVDIENS